MSEENKIDAAAEVPAPAAGQRKLAAVMFTDIVGYSRMMHQDEAGTLAFLAEHNAILQEQVKLLRGRVIKTIGDSFMVDFKSVVDAVNCAVAIQTKLHERNSGLPAPLRRFIRVGIHLGDVVVTGRDIFGEGVNIAARLEPLSPYGGICVSGEVTAQLKGLRHLKLIPRGLQSLKNISHPVATFQVWAPGMDPTAGRRYQWARKKTRLAGLAAGVLVALAALAALPRWMEWREARGWEPWLVEDFRDWQAFSTRWQSEAVALGRDGAALENGWLRLKKPVPVRAFRLKVTYRVRPGSPADLSLSAMDTQREGAGLIVRRVNDPRLRWQRQQLGRRLGNEVEDEALRVRAAASNGGRHWQSLTYDSHRLRSLNDDDGWWRRLFSERLAFQTWIRRSPQDGFFRFTLQGQGVWLEKVEIHFKRADSEDDVATRAGAYALDGRGPTALKLYSDLYDLSKDPVEQSALLLRQALIHASAGNLKAAVNLYQRILKNFPENPASGYARLDLGLAEMDLAASAARGKARDRDKIRRRHGEEAQGYFAGLIKRQKRHPEAARAAFLMAQNSFEHLGDAEAGRQRALQLVKAGGPYAERALGLLLRSFQGPGGKPGALDLAQALDVLEPLVKQESLPGPLHERAAEALAEAQRQSGRHDGLAALVTHACQSRLFSLAGREAVLRQWVLAEAGGLPEAAFLGLAAALEREGREALAFHRAYLRSGGTRSAARAQAALRKALRVDLLDGGAKDPKRREYLDWTHGEFDLRLAAAGTVVLPRDEGGLTLRYQRSASAQILSIRPGLGPYSVDRPEGRAVDLGIYRRASFKARLPRGARFSLRLAEFGAADPGARHAKGPKGSDGEQYELGAWVGTGQWQRLSADLKDARPDLGWGNQEGDLRLALAAVGAVTLQLPPGQGPGQLEFKELMFER